MDRVPEPYDAPPAAIRWRWLPVAIAAGFALAMAAPDPWPEGPATVILSIGGHPAITGQVIIPIDEPVALESGAFSVRFDSGIATEQPIEAVVTYPPTGIQPSAEHVDLTLTLADGRSELIPILRHDQDTRSFTATRRPPVGTTVVMGVLGAVVILWVTEAIPLFVTSLIIPVVLVVGGTAPAKDALAPFFHPIIALFFGGFLMAEAMRRVRLDHLAAISLVARAGRSPRTLAVALMGVAAFLSMWMSNTAAVAVLIPIALAVTTPLDRPGYQRTVVLGVAYAATIGGVGSAIGTPANPLAIEFLDSFAGRSISFIEWFAFGLPMVVLFLPIMAAYIWWRLGGRLESASFTQARAVARAELEKAGGLDRDQLVVLSAFSGVMIAWLTQTFHGLDTGIIALGGAVALALVGKVKSEDLTRISWASLITFGGGLTLGVFLTESGAADWLASLLAGMAGVPRFVSIGIVAVVALAMTTVASNTATAAMLIPLAIPLASVLGVDPTLLVVTVAVASSIDFALVIGTPPTMMAYSTGLFSSRAIFKTGIVLDLIGLILLITGVTAFWRLIGLV